MHRYLLHNEEIVEASAKVLGPGQTGVMNGWGVFSTIRVEQGTLFVWERHFDRMRHDAQLMRIPFPSEANRLERDLLRLVEANQALHATLRVAVIRNAGGMWEGPGDKPAYDVVAFTTDRAKWAGSAKLGVVEQARHADSPFRGTKLTSWATNLVWYQQAHEQGLDEMVLLNERGEVAECTSANLFAVRGRTVATPPLTAGCLPGTIRAVLLEDVTAPGIEVVERTLHLADLYDADEVFLTSATRDLIAVSRIGDRLLHQQAEVRQALQSAFRQYLEHYTKGALDRLQDSPLKAL